MRCPYCNYITNATSGPARDARSMRTFWMMLMIFIKIGGCYEKIDIGN
nr:MAG TPA: cysteine-rich protein [Caudoviricetes sp.]